MSDVHRLLLISTNDLLGRSLTDQLNGEGFSLDIRRPEQDVAAQACDAAELLLLDDGTSGLELVEFCDAVRDQGFTGPILALGAPSDATQAAGVDEWIAKPFRLASLLSRLNHHLRHADKPNSSADGLPLGPYVFHPLARHLIKQDGGRIPLTEKETAVIAYLQAAQGRVVSRDELLEDVWGYSGAASTHTVETHIYQLRRKLVKAGEETPLVVTESGGYRLAETDPSA